MQATTGVLRTREPHARRIGRRALAIVGAIAVLVGATYSWQHALVNERQSALDRAESTATAARARASALEAQVVDLGGRIEALRRRSEAMRARVREVGKGRQHLATLLRASEHDLKGAEARMTALLGSPLADGRYFGSLVLVGATQDPPRLVVDLEQWFTEAAATEAADEDGVLPPDGVIPNDYYIRNESLQWRILPIDPAATVSLTIPFGQVDAPLMVTLSRFGKVFSADRGHVSESHYWIAVRDGTVVAIEEQYLP